jgi:hypothetical protein
MGLSPQQLSGCAAWFKADLGTFQDPGLTVPASAEGHPVGGWADQSRRNLVLAAVQPTALNKPVLRLNQQRGLPMLSFAGAGRYLTAHALASIITGTATPFSWMFVFKSFLPASYNTLASVSHTPFTADDLGIGVIDAGCGPNQLYFYRENTGNLNWTELRYGVLLDETLHYVLYTFDGSVSRYWVDGLELTLALNYVNGVYPTSLILNTYHIGDWAGYPGYDWISLIGEHALWDHVLSFFERVCLFDYLKNKWVTPTV